MSYPSDPVEIRGGGMTAENTATVREAARSHLASNGDWNINDWRDIATALLAQAEDGTVLVKALEAWETIRLGLRQRIEEAEADRDAALDREAGTNDALQEKHSLLCEAIRRGEKMEADRDAAVRALDTESTAAQANWTRAITAERAAEQAKGQMEQAKQVAAMLRSTEDSRIRELREERDQAREALRRVSYSFHQASGHPRSFDVCTWPMCRIARAALTREGTKPTCEECGETTCCGDHTHGHDAFGCAVVE